MERGLPWQDAERVEGVDISPEMARVAQRAEQEQGRGVHSHVCDAAALPHLGDFDLVTAVYLLNYARTRPVPPAR